MLNFANKIIIGDEVTFAMNGSVTTKNVVEYAPIGERPDFNYDVSSSREKVNVWAVFAAMGDYWVHFSSKIT